MYLPPAWFRSPEPQLPVIEMIAGVPGEPSDWTRAGYADTTSRPSPPGTRAWPRYWSSRTTTGTRPRTPSVPTASSGKAETYLVKDVPDFMQANFNAAVGKHSLAVAGLSAGGTCATILALRNPKVFQTFAEYSGYSDPTYQNDNEQQTIAQLYGGSKSDYEDHDPVHLLKTGQYPDTAGWFTAGPERSATPGRGGPATGAGQEGRPETGLCGHAPRRPLLRVLGRCLQGLTALAVVAFGPDAGAEGPCRPHCDPPVRVNRGRPIGGPKHENR